LERRAAAASPDAASARRFTPPPAIRSGKPGDTENRSVRRQLDEDDAGLDEVDVAAGDVVEVDVDVDGFVSDFESVFVPSDDVFAASDVEPLSSAFFPPALGDA
jgi:hypothetical protein